MDTLVSHAASTGRFDAVNGHEPKSAPRSGISCSLWVDSLRPCFSSGLASTSIAVVFMVRIQTSMLAEPADATEPNLVSALDDLMSAYMGDFELGANARSIDVRGSDSEGVSASAGYLNQDGKLYRVFDITLPVIVNDAWTESP